VRPVRSNPGKVIKFERLTNRIAEIQKKVKPLREIEIKFPR
jgi:hypothetical protein